jgi:hypothetical protein
MTPQQKAESLGLKFEKQAPGYLNLCIRSGKQLITSGHVSNMKGKLGAGLSTEEGRQAARECARKSAFGVGRHGTLDGLRVLKVLGCVNSAPDFIEQHLVINGCSDSCTRFSARTATAFTRVAHWGSLRCRPAWPWK